MLTAGDEIAGYRIERIVGRGGMGVVYEATQLSLDRRVALKVLTHDLTGDDVFRARFRREGRIQARLDHPNIVTVHEAGESAEGLFLAMRYIGGPTLKALIVARELDPQRALRILSPVADALDAAHSSGLVHRDVKPQNILVATGDHPYLADFGLTKSASETAITADGNFIGTLDYIAPEQIRAESVTPRTDVYSFGAVLYEALTGVVPFPLQSQAAVIYAHMATPPPRVSDARPELPRGLDAVIAKALSKDPSQRQATAGHVVAETRMVLSAPHVSASSAPPPLLRAQDTGVREEERRVPTVEAEARGSTGATAAQPAASRSPLRIALLLLLLAGLGAGVGIVLGNGAADGGSTSSSRSYVSAGNLALTPPGAWNRVADRHVAGLGLRDAVTLGEGTGGSRALEVGSADVSGAPLLPAAFVDRLATKPKEERVRLGRYDAYRFAGLRPKTGGGEMTVYAIPTTGGVATAACLTASGLGTAATAAFMTRCGRAAETIRLIGVKPYPVGPDPAYAARLNSALANLSDGRGELIGRLRRASKPATQAGAARGLSALYARAARGIPVRGLSPELTPTARATATAVQGTSIAYRAMSGAAARADRGAFAAATKRVRAYDKALRVSLARLASLGYRVAR